jgi:hypothetical protein
VLNAIRKLLGRAKPHRVTKFAHPELGTLQWSEDDNYWEVSVAVGDNTIRFLVGGDSEPSELLLSHARDIARNLPDFLSMVSGFLSAEAEKNSMSAYSDEIKQLQIEQVCLFWPNRPNDGMIFFHAEENYPAWRCDYVNRRPRSLGFDS